MKKNIVFLFSVLLLVSSCKTKKAITPSSVDLHNIRLDVETLSDDKMEGRETGTQGEKMAARYISDRMKSIGLTPLGIGDGYLQLFKKTIKANPHAEKSSPDDQVITGYNVIGYLNNDAKYNVVIGAHYDHLGYGGQGSLHTGPPEIHNGADDNASGVAGMLRIAEALKNRSDLQYNFIFIGFSGEEKGLWGSNYFSKYPTLPFSTFSYMINMDMIGRLSEDKKIAIYGTGTTPVWRKYFDTGAASQFKIKEELSGVGPSDHTSFYLGDLPVLHFFTGQHADYHRPSDDAHLINYTGIKEVTKLILDIIDFTNERGKLRFTKTNDESTETPDFKVTLGVVPDYLFDGKGMRIDGVREGRPASRSNLKKGDIVVKMGDLEIVDMMSYMKALGVYEKGQTIDITIMRDGKENTRKLTF